MIICVFECNTRRHLVGLFDSIEALQEKCSECMIAEMPKEKWPTDKYNPRPEDYNATRVWWVDRPNDYPDDVDLSSVWPFGYEADGVIAYEVNEAPNRGIDWSEN